MSCKNILVHLLDKGTIATVLSRSNEKKEEVVDFQLILHQLGFDEELDWGRYGADGFYGAACARAVQLFAERNGIASNGNTITTELAKLLIARYDSLDELQDIDQHIVAEDVEAAINSQSTDKASIAALQTLLNDLGYGEALKWEKYRNDGDYGNCTIAAVEAFYQQEGIAADPKKLSIEGAKKICELIGQHYGDRWSENVKVERNVAEEEREKALVPFAASNFQGKKVFADVLFVPSLEKINAFAVTNNVRVHVTSSWRANAKVAGAIVTPAKKSNHMAGHAIDMNVVFEGGWANSSYLKKGNQANWHPGVAGFIKAIQDDPELRWGGDFRTPDTVHIDDGLNINDPDKWKERYLETQKDANV